MLILLNSQLVLTVERHFGQKCCYSEESLAEDTSRLEHSLDQCYDRCYNFILSVAARTGAVCSSKRLRSPIFRSNSQTSEYDVEAAAGERTPLLFTAKISGVESVDEHRHRQLPSAHATALFGILALTLFLLVGIIIAVYLLLLQVPRPWPVSHPFYLVERQMWWPYSEPLQASPLNKSSVLNVILLHTRSEPCRDQSSCTQFVKQVQNDTWTRTGAHIPYNFLIGGDGKTYEGRGWKAQHGFPDLPGRNDTIVVGIIGTYSDRHPDAVMYAEVKALLTESIRRFYLLPGYKLYGVVNGSQPENDGKALYAELQHLKHWRGLINV
ncbi:peptidoglycan-recognition protein 3-like isoform X1 [Culex pipiens pallens]|uniref:peptidoglycan-recognition protein 3-like isoform X1 n=1 Tax=Culex pipiens pallens TaxID=42434 RepID=UPI0019535714|nr:peptidoglycan-recognition protein 3-like isoform X1 [Culex pipiens pallens]